MTEEYINKGKLIEEIRKAASRSVVGEIDEPYLDWKTVVSFIFDAPVEAVAPTEPHVWGFKKYVGEDYEADMAKMELCPITQEWWKHTKPCFVKYAMDPGSEFYHDMKHIFYHG